MQYSAKTNYQRQCKGKKKVINKIALFGLYNDTVIFVPQMGIRIFSLVKTIDKVQQLHKGIYKTCEYVSGPIYVIKCVSLYTIDYICGTKNGIR